MKFDLEIKQTQAGLNQLSSLFNQMKPIEYQKTVIWITFGNSLNFDSISPESLAVFILAIQNKVKMDKSEVENMLLEVVKNHQREFEDNEETDPNKSNIFEMFGINGLS